MSEREIYYCEVCGMPYAERHHVIYKSESILLKEIDLNFKYLCAEHHKGNNGPHKNRYVDLTYKLEVQDKLFQLFSKEFYTEKEIQHNLKTTPSTARKICKKLKIYKDGYNSRELIQRLMGNRLYTREQLKEVEYENPWKGELNGRNIYTL